MGVFVGLILIAAGAVLVWGVTGSPSGIDLDAVGVILIVVGLVGFFLDLLLWSDWGPGLRRRGRVVPSGPVYDDTVYEERRYVRPRITRRVTTVEDDTAPPPP